MKKMILSVACGLAVVLAIGLSLTAIGQAFADQCNNCTMCGEGFGFTGWWSSDVPTPPVNAMTNGNFNFNMELNWTSACPNYWEDATIQFSGTPQNIVPSSVIYLPNLLTLAPNCACGDWTVNASGTLSCHSVDGVLVTEAKFIRPGATLSPTKTVIITHTASTCNQM